jgi:hypothetical protein
MSRARHGGKKGFGGTKAVQAGGNPKVMEEAKPRKKGGKVDCAPEGGMAKKRMDRPRRQSGGRVGADRSPFSSAHGSTSPGKAAD